MRCPLVLLFLVLGLTESVFAQSVFGTKYFGKPTTIEASESEDEFRYSNPPTLSLFHTFDLLIRLDAERENELSSAFTRLFSLEAYRRGQLEIGQEFLKRELERSPTPSHKAETQLLQVLEVLSNGQSLSVFHKAADLFSDINSSELRGEPNILAEYYYWYGETLRALDRHREAITYYDSTRSLGKNIFLYHEASYRKAEVKEEILLYEEARRDFDSIASSNNRYRLYAAFREASLLRSQGEYPQLLKKLAKLSTLLNENTEKLNDTLQPYISFTGLSLEDPSLRNAHLVGSGTRLFDTSTALLSPSNPIIYFDLLAASGYSGIGKFDSATIFLAKATSISKEIAVDRYLVHLLQFEEGWVALSKGENATAAEIFSALANEDSVSQSTSTVSHQVKGITGTFYHEGDAKFTIEGTDTIFASKERYDDIPSRAKFYQGIALFRAGKLAEAKDILTTLSQDETAIYSDKARYHLALAEFSAKEMIRAQSLLEPIAKRRSRTGVYAAILLGDINYRRATYAKAADYFSFALANLSSYDTTLIAVSSLERGLSLVPLNAWTQTMNDLSRFVLLSKPNAPGLDEALFWLGRAYLKNDSIDAARVTFKRVLDEFPNSERQIDAEYGYGWALFRGGDYQAADKSFERVMQLDSITRYAYDALSRRGDAAYAAGAIAKAVKIYNVAVDRPTFDEYRTARSMFQLGVLRMRADSARSAINAFQYIINKLPKSDLHDRAYYNLAVAAYGIKLNDRANDAIATLTKKYSASAFSPRGLYLQAGERERNGDAKDAYQSYRKIISSYPDAPEFRPALFGALETLVEMNRNSDAINLADSFYSKYSTATFASALLYRKGDIEYDAERYKESRKTFDRFTDIYEKDTLYANARVMIAKSIVASGGSRSEAKNILEDITERYSTHDAAAFAYLELARLAKKDDPEKAPEYYSKAFDMQYYSSDAAPIAMLEYGRYWKESNPDSAKRIFEELTKRYLIETSIGAKAQQEIISIFLADGNKASAMGKLAAISSAHKGDAIGVSSSIQLADLHYQNGAFKKSLDIYESLLQYDLTTEQLVMDYFGSAKDQIKLGQKKNAIGLLRKITAMRGASGPRKEQAQELLQTLVPKKKKK